MTVLIDTAGLVPVDADERRARLGEAGAAWTDRFDTDRAAAHMTWV